MLTLKDHPNLELPSDRSIKGKIWTSGVFKIPFVLRAKGICRWWDIPISGKQDVSVTSPFPPWNVPEIEVHLELRSKIQNYESDEIKKRKFFETIERYGEGWVHIYTDGSKKVTEGNSSTAAAFIVPSEIVLEKFRLNPMSSVLGSELYAIEKAAEWILENQVANSQYLILSDSKSALQMLINWWPKTHRRVVFNIQRMVKEIAEQGGKVIFQWVPGHSGIKGNELVDRLAKQGLEDNKCMNNTLDRSEKQGKIREMIIQDWQMEWDAVKDSTPLGRIKDRIGDWKWAYSKCRQKETVMARLRCQCVGVNKYLYKINRISTPLCDTCGVDEDVEHFLLDCRKYAKIRRKMVEKLRKKGVTTINLKTLLGGSDKEEDIQREITNILYKFLVESGKLDSL